jgi:hypothetical protein
MGLRSRTRTPSRVNRCDAVLQRDPERSSRPEQDGRRLKQPGRIAKDVRSSVDSSSVAPQVVTAASTLGAVVVTVWVSGRRDRQFRNHTERTQTASDCFAAFDAVRRAVRMELYFGEPVTVAMKKAERALGLEQPMSDAAKIPRGLVIGEVKRELEPERGPVRRG